jgi:hypothetical protein
MERIVRLLTDHKLRERFGERGRETVRRRFLMPQLMQDWLDPITSFEAHFLLARGRDARPGSGAIKASAPKPAMSSR